MSLSVRPGVRFVPYLSLHRHSRSPTLTEEGMFELCASPTLPVGAEERAGNDCENDVLQKSTPSFKRWEQWLQQKEQEQLLLVPHYRQEYRVHLRV